MVCRIDALYAIEREIRQLEPDQRTEVRRERAALRLDALIGRARELQQQVLPLGKLG